MIMDNEQSAIEYVAQEMGFDDSTLVRAVLDDDHDGAQRFTRILVKEVELRLDAEAKLAQYERQDVELPGFEMADSDYERACDEGWIGQHPKLLAMLACRERQLLAQLRVTAALREIVARLDKLQYKPEGI